MHGASCSEPPQQESIVITTMRCFSALFLIKKPLKTEHQTQIDPICFCSNKRSLSGRVDCAKRMCSGCYRFRARARQACSRDGRVVGHRRANSAPLRPPGSQRRRHSAHRIAPAAGACDYVITATVLTSLRCLVCRWLATVRRSVRAARSRTSSPTCRMLMPTSGLSG